MDRISNTTESSADRNQLVVRTPTPFCRAESVSRRMSFVKSPPNVLLVSREAMQNMENGEAIAGLWFRTYLLLSRASEPPTDFSSSADCWSLCSIHEMQELSGKWWTTGECVVEAVASRIHFGRNNTQILLSQPRCQHQRESLIESISKLVGLSLLSLPMEMTSCQHMQMKSQVRIHFASSNTYIYLQLSCSHNSAGISITPVYPSQDWHWPGHIGRFQLSSASSIYHRNLKETYPYPCSRSNNCRRVSTRWPHIIIANAGC